MNELIATKGFQRILTFSIHSYKFGNMSARTASVERNTSETQITCTIDLDHVPGVTKQVIEVNTGIGFLDHVCPFLYLLLIHRTTPLDVRFI